ncbi:COG4315 family predicted lipoprotein [Thiosocius teredinicola]|uniref:COG4315 family predicted lipoprotein n=1 Tax=Thiosocius teredinicola TaxID=1973002 RepID=UPI000991319F
MKFSTALKLVSLGAMALTTAAACTSGYYKSAEHSSTLTDHRGMVVYTFDKDTAHTGQSNCYGPCASTWPPVVAGDIRGSNIGRIERTDGQAQATYKGEPLYYYLGDANPGDENGDGVGGVWHSAKRQPAYQSNASYSYGGYGAY